MAGAAPAALPSALAAANHPKTADPTGRRRRERRRGCRPSLSPPPSSRLTTRRSQRPWAGADPAAPPPPLPPPSPPLPAGRSAVTACRRRGVSILCRDAELSVGWGRSPDLCVPEIGVLRSKLGVELRWGRLLLHNPGRVSRNRGAAVGLEARNRGGRRRRRL